jgi:hypothetical protein
MGKSRKGAREATPVTHTDVLALQSACYDLHPSII